MAKDTIGIREFIRENLVESRINELEIPFIRPKSILRFRPMGIETKIDTSRFEQAINRTLYLSLKHLWFRGAEPKPKNRVVIDATDGSFDVTTAANDGWFYVENATQFKLFFRASRYLDIDIQNDGKDPKGRESLNNVKYLLSDFHLTTILFLSALEDCLKEENSLKAQAKLLGYLYCCNQEDYLKTLSMNAPIVAQIQAILAAGADSEEPGSFAPLAQPFVAIGRRDRSIPIKLSLVIRLLMQLYFKEELETSAKKIKAEDVKLYDKVVFGSKMTAEELSKISTEVSVGMRILSQAIEVLYSNLVTDISSQLLSDTPIKEMPLDKLKGSAGFLCIARSIEGSKTNPILRNECFFFEDTQIADRLWSGEGENIFLAAIDSPSDRAAWQAISDTAQSSDSFDRLADKVIEYARAGLFTNQFLENMFRSFIPTEVFKAVTGSEKPASYKEFKQQAYLIAKKMPLLQNTRFMKGLDKRLQEAGIYLEYSVKLYGELSNRLNKSKAELRELKAKGDKADPRLVAYFKELVAKETFALYSLQYEIKQKRSYMQKQGATLGQGATQFDPKAVSLGTLPAWLTAKGVALVALLLVASLASLYFFLLHESPANRYLSALREELEDVRDRLESECKEQEDRDNAYCRALLEQMKSIQKEMEAAHRAVRDERTAVDALTQGLGDAAKIGTDLIAYGFYGLFGLGLLWGGVKAFNIISTARAAKKQAQ